MTKGEPTDRLLSLTGRVMQDVSRLPSHPDECVVRETLFTNSKLAQRQTIQFLHHVTGVDVEPLLANFSRWEKDKTVPASLTQMRVIKYFDDIARPHKPAPEEDERGGVALGEERAKQSSLSIPRLELFFRTLNYQLVETTESTSGPFLIRKVRSLPKGFLDEFIEKTIGNSEEGQKFRAFLAMHLFIDIHDNLIRPPHGLVRDLDAQVYHQMTPANPLPLKALQEANAEMQQILLELPFSATNDYQSRSSRLRGIAPALLKYLPPLGWDTDLKRIVTFPHARRMREVRESLRPELN